MNTRIGRVAERKGPAAKGDAAGPVQPPSEGAGLDPSGRCPRSCGRACAGPLALILALEQAPGSRLSSRQRCAPSRPSNRGSRGRPRCGRCRAAQRMMHSAGFADRLGQDDAVAGDRSTVPTCSSSLPTTSICSRIAEQLPLRPAALAAPAEIVLELRLSSRGDNRHSRRPAHAGGPAAAGWRVGLPRAKGRAEEAAGLVVLWGGWPHCRRGGGARAWGADQPRTPRPMPLNVRCSDS